MSAGSSAGVSPVSFTPRQPGAGETPALLRRAYVCR